VTGREWTVSEHPALVLGAACLLLHLVVNNGYGAFSDELYFIVCGLHPQLGYVDQPPLVPWIAGASYNFFGTALLPLRFIPALSMAATVALTCDVARRLGGGVFSQWLSGTCVLLGGVFLVDGLLLSTDMMQPLTWLGCGWCLIRICESKDERWWLAFGVIAGVSLLSKYLILFYLAGLAVGILATPLRRSLAKPWIYLGAATAFAFLAPSAWWQAAHGWPFFALGKAEVATRNLALSPLVFAAQQVLFAGPASSLVWLAGLWHFTVRPRWPELRVFPIAYAAMAALFYVLHGKAYYLAPVYPVLLAGGAVAIEGWFGWRLARGAVLGAVSVVGLLLAPLALPVLPPQSYGAYARALGLSPGAAATEKGPQSVLPLHLAGMFGWHEMAQKVSAVYRALPARDRAHAVFYGRDYGEASAVELFGKPLQGPPVYSGHNNFYLSPPEGDEGAVVIVLGDDVKPLMANYGSATVVGRIDAPYAEAWETGLSIYVLRNPRRPLVEIWPKLKYFD